MITTINEFKKLLNESNNYNLNENFWRWFDNSKIIDENDNPLITYHGTNSNFRDFDKIKKGSTTDPGLRGQGFYFTTNKKTAQSYGKYVYEVYLKSNNPIDLLSFNSLDEIINLLEIDPSIIHERGRGTNYHSISVYLPFSSVFSSNVIEKGFDGIKHGQEIIVFEPNQIKSIENDGSWNTLSNDIFS